MFDEPIVVVKNADSEQCIYDAPLSAFSNKLFCDGGVAALQTLEQSPASVVIAEDNTGDMSGIEIAEAIREIDAETMHFTYIILLGGESTEQVKQAFTSTIDAFVTNSEDLAQVVVAAGRLSQQINNANRTNTELTIANAELKKGQLLDPLTGLGNRLLAEQGLRDTIKQIESRGGVACVMIISVQNYLTISEKHNQSVAEDLIVSIAEKLQHLIRPLDIVSYFAPGQFALVLMQPTLEQCNAECYQRIFDGIRLKTYKTIAGFLPASIAMSVCASHAENGAPNPNTMIRHTLENLDAAYQQGAILVHHLSPEE